MPQPWIQEFLTGRQDSIPSRGQRLRIRPMPKRILRCPPATSTVRLPKSRSTRTRLPATAAATQAASGARTSHTTTTTGTRPGRQQAAMTRPSWV